ncbi:exportin/importin beta family protein [bacterium]|nr:exportin/importin beta family protein [bacterium]
MADAAQQQMLAAVQALHTDPNPAAKQAANEWLTAFQESAEAWSVADAVLHTAGVPMEATFQAVQTLSRKMQRDFRELPPEQHLPLRDSIIAHAHNFSAGPAPVTTQICLSLAAFAVQCPAWEDPVSSVVSSFNQSAQDTACALRILQLLPEESSNPSLDADYYRREEFRMQLSTRFRDVVTFLCQCCQQWEAAGTAPTSAHTALVQCFDAWLYVIPNDFPIAELAASPLVHLVLGGLSIPDRFDACAECIAHLVWLSGGGPRGAPLAEVVVPAVMGMRPLFSEFLQAGDTSEDEARAVTRIFVELAETHSDFVLTATPEAMQVVDCLLLCGECPVERIARMPFNFWYHLSDDVTHPDRPELRAAFTPCFVRWMNSLIALLRYPDDYDSQPADRQDDFKKFRYAVADAVKDACRVITADVCLERFWRSLTELMGAQTQSWQGVEAVLYGVRSIAKTIRNDEATYLPQIMQLVPTLPAHPPLQYTAALMIGATSEWLPSHPEFLGPLFPYLVNLLESPASADAAALSIKNVCETCRDLFTEEATATSLMQLYEARSDMLESTAAVDLTLAVTQAVSAMPEHMMMAALPILVRTPLVKVQSLLPGFAAGASKETKKAMIAALKRLVAIFQVFGEARKDEGARGQRFDVPLDVAHPCAGIVAQVWEGMDAVLMQCIADCGTMENACKVVKYMVATMQKHARPLLPVLLQKLVACFDQAQHSCFLYLSASMVNIFGDSSEPADQAALDDVLVKFTQKLCAGSGVLCTEEGFGNMPDVVEDFFDFAARYCRYCPMLILHRHPELMGGISTCGMKGLGCEHKVATRSLLDFYDRALALGVDEHRYGAETIAAQRPAIQGVFRPIGEQLVGKLLGGVAGGLPYDRCREAGVVLFSLRKCFAAAGACEADAWIFSALSALSPTRYTNANKQEYMALLQAAGDAKAVKNVLQSIASATRR